MTSNDMNEPSQNAHNFIYGKQINPQTISAAQVDSQKAKATIKEERENVNTFEREKKRTGQMNKIHR